MNAKSNELSIIIYSCIRNKDMWSVFSTLFRKYWDECDYKIYLLTDKFDEEQKYIFDEVICIDSDWADMILTALRKINMPYVMLFMDDYLLNEPVKNEDIENALRIVKKESAANLRMCYTSLIKADPYDADVRCEQYMPGKAYSLSTHVGIWDTAFLNKVIKPGWSAWDFERIGSFEMKNFEQPILRLRDYNFPYIEGVRKGKWLPEGVRICTHNNIELDYKVRPKMSCKENLIVLLKGLIIKANPDLILYIQNKIGRK